MIDPFTALAAVKGALSAGKTIASMSKEIGGFFDAIDDAKKSHQKKKESIFSSSNEKALDTWLRKQRATDAEQQLKEIIIATRGYSAYQDLLKLRKQMADERREQEKQKRREAEEFRQNLEYGIVLFFVIILIVGLALAAFRFGGY